MFFFSFELHLKWDNIRNASIESDFHLDSEIKVVTDEPEIDENETDIYDDDDKPGKTDRGTNEDPDIDVDYEGSTNVDDLSDRGASSSSTTEFPHSNNCRGDDAISCPRSPHIKICENQFCDGIEDCPQGEDEHSSQCPPLGRFFIFSFVFDLIFFNFLFLQFNVESRSTL